MNFFKKLLRPFTKVVTTEKTDNLTQCEAVQSEEEAQTFNDLSKDEVDNSSSSSIPFVDPYLDNKIQPSSEMLYELVSIGSNETVPSDAFEVSMVNANYEAYRASNPQKHIASIEVDVESSESVKESQTSVETVQTLVRKVAEKAADDEDTRQYKQTTPQRFESPKSTPPNKSILVKGRESTHQMSTSVKFSEQKHVMEIAAAKKLQRPVSNVTQRRSSLIEVELPDGSSTRVKNAPTKETSMQNPVDQQLSRAKITSETSLEAMRKETELFGEMFAKQPQWVSDHEGEIKLKDDQKVVAQPPPLSVKDLESVKTTSHASPSVTRKSTKELETVEDKPVVVATKESKGGSKVEEKRDLGLDTLPEHLRELVTVAPKSHIEQRISTKDATEEDIPVEVAPSESKGGSNVEEERDVGLDASSQQSTKELATVEAKRTASEVVEEAQDMKRDELRREAKMRLSVLSDDPQFGALERQTARKRTSGRMPSDKLVPLLLQKLSPRTSQEPAYGSNDLIPLHFEDPNYVAPPSEMGLLADDRPVLPKSIRVSMPELLQERRLGESHLQIESMEGVRESTRKAGKRKDSREEIRQNELIAAARARRHLEMKLQMVQEAVRQTSDEYMEQLLQNAGSSNSTDDLNRWSSEVDADQYEQDDDMTQGYVKMLEMDDHIIDRRSGPDESQSLGHLALMFGMHGSMRGRVVGHDPRAALHLLTMSILRDPNLLPTMSDVSLNDEYMIVTRMRVRARALRLTPINVPMNVIAAESQVRDVRRGELKKLYQIDMARHTTLDMFDEPMDYRARKWYHWIGYYIKRLFKYGPKSRVISLRSYEFYAMLFFHEINVEKQSLDFEAFLSFGPVLGMIIKLIEVACMDTPMMMFAMTMAAYTRFYYLRYFDAMPMLRGVGYCMFMIFIINELRGCFYLELGTKTSVRLAGMRDNWIECDKSTLPNWREKCMEFPSNYTQNAYCPKPHQRWNGTLNFPTQHFMRFHMGNLYDSVKYQSSITETSFSYFLVGIVWCTVFILSLGGFHRSHRVLIRLQILLVLPVVISTCIAIIYRFDYLSARYVYNPWEKFANFTQMQHIMRIGVNFNPLPFLIWVSAMKPPELNPEIATLRLMSMKFMWQLMIFLAAEVSIFNVIRKYKINPNCFTIERRMAIFVLMPDFFAETNFGTLWTTCWIIIMTYYLCVRTVYVLQMTIESICQVQPFLRRYPLILSVCLCGLGMAVVRAHYNEQFANFLTMTLEYKVDSCYLLMFAIYIIGLRFFYTWTRFYDDFMYVYGRPPHRFWYIWLNVLSYISILIIMFVFVGEIYINKMQNVTMFIFMLIVCVICVSVMLAHVCHYVRQWRVEHAILPMPTWKPYDSAISNFRRFYFSSRDEKHRHRFAFVCTHRCLNQLKLFRNIVMVQQYKSRAVFTRWSMRAPKQELEEVEMIAFEPREARGRVSLTID